MKNILLFLFILLNSVAKAQFVASDLMGPSGDLFKANNIQMEWTLGELAIETLHNNNYLTQGFLQGSSILIVGNNEIKPISNTIQINAYPNPFTTGFELLIQNIKPNDEFEIKVFDVLGKIVYTSSLLRDGNNASQYINLTNICPSMYFVNVYQNYNLIKTIKVNKI